MTGRLLSAFWLAFFFAPAAIASTLSDYVVFGCSEDSNEHRDLFPLVLKRMEDGSIEQVPSGKGLDLSDGGRIEVLVSEPTDGVFLMYTPRFMARVSDEGLVLVEPGGEPSSHFCMRIDLTYLDALEAIGPESETFELVANELADRAVNLASVASVSGGDELKEEISRLQKKNELIESEVTAKQEENEILRTQIRTLESERDALEWYAGQDAFGYLSHLMSSQMSEEVSKIKRELVDRLGRPVRDLR